MSFNDLKKESECFKETGPVLIGQQIEWYEGTPAVPGRYLVLDTDELVKISYFKGRRLPDLKRIRDVIKADGKPYIDEWEGIKDHMESDGTITFSHRDDSPLYYAPIPQIIPVTEQQKEARLEKARRVIDRALSADL